MAAAWPEALARLRLSVNITASDIVRPGFAAQFLELVAASGFERGRLTVEVTESGLIEDLNAAAYLLRIPLLVLQPIAAPLQGFPATPWYAMAIPSISQAIAFACMAWMRPSWRRRAAAAMAQLGSARAGLETLLLP